MPDLSGLTELILTYRYAILLPLAIVEGPLVALASGFLISLGYLELLPVIGVMILGDLVPDSLYYYFGLRGHQKGFASRYIARTAFVATHLELLQKFWTTHPGKTMFLSKLAYGLSIPLLISAGFVKMSYRTFITYSIPVTIFQYGIIMAAGYYLGHSYQSASKYIEWVGAGITVILVLCVIAYVVIQQYARKEVMRLSEKDL